MRKTILLTLAIFGASIICGAQISLSDLRTERLVNPMGLSTKEQPTLSWIINSKQNNTVQSAYELNVKENGKNVWSSGKVNSDNSITVKYEGPLKPDSRYDWTVKVWDNHGKSASAASFFTTGLNEWKAEWVGKARRQAPLYFRKQLILNGKVKSATAYISARGIYEASIDGKKIGDDLLTPGWTAYHKRIQYQAYDITPMLKSGTAEIGAMVTPGWYSGGMNTFRCKGQRQYFYGGDISLLMQVNVKYADGREEIIATDGSWECSEGETSFATIYHGQTINHNAVYNWTPVQLTGRTKAEIVPTKNQPVRELRRIKPVQVIKTPAGETVLDFGQNIVGWEESWLSGEKNDTVMIQHAEILDNNGNFYTRNLRRARARTTCILKGEGREFFRPSHTFYGFRYIKLIGLRGEVNPDDFTAVAISSGFENHGKFESSNPTINKLVQNIWWGFHDNFVDIPTDCPQRDERLGWTGDAQVFFRTASFLGDVDAFFRKWLADLALEQRKDGTVPCTIPHVQQHTTAESRSTAGWSDCAVIVPWQHYQAYGDKAVLAAQYKSMKAWTDYMINTSRDNNYLYIGPQRWGDWLFWSPADDRHGKAAVTSKHLIGQAFFAGACETVSKTARLLGNMEDAEYYDNIHEFVVKAFNDEYVTPNGLISSDTQTAYVLALHFGLLPENKRAQAAKRLVDNISRYDDHLTTGFLGTPYICGVLTDNGYSDVAYKLLLQDTCPSWIYPVLHGATTIWERWDSVRDDGTITGGMNSFNHYSLGAVGDWLFRSAVGIRELEPGYRKIAICPHAGGEFTSMSAEKKTPYGVVSAAWTAKGNRIESLEVQIPVGTTALVSLPDGSVKELGSGKYKFENK